MRVEMSLKSQQQLHTLVASAAAIAEHKQGLQQVVNTVLLGEGRGRREGQKGGAERRDRGRGRKEGQREGQWGGAEGRGRREGHVSPHSFGDLHTRANAHAHTRPSMHTCTHATYRTDTELNSG